ncbi:MAG: DUF1428 domain-containing protein [Euryhalocaulis sp.]|uniref:DUF1428 domain-containing protein n=1 Tax=Euryhalocaulis sp. TaxID=2744307 RepID=UPI0018163D9E|nr:DUF1428 domain-containing protein [Euryhalocaulis sp.]MBA4800283.1 DUF1428 domain-containing protein [Euryhalocaulis sp.]
MTYVEGFVAAVPAKNKEEYRKHAADAAPLFREFGAARMVECWGDDVPSGKLTDFSKAVKAEDGEVVVFSWFEYPDRETRDAANEKMMNDPRMQDMGETMPFDGKRMIFGGFAPILDEKSGGDMGYVDGMLVAVPTANRGAYQEMALKAAKVFQEYGANRVVETWSDDVPDGKVTDFRRAVKAKDGEDVVFSWIEWSSKEARDEAWPKMMEDERMKPDHHAMPFDGMRMIYGGFAPIVEA